MNANKSRPGFLMRSNSLTNFEIQKYHQNEAKLSSQNGSKFNDLHSRNNLPKIKTEAYVINIGKFKSVGTLCIVLPVNSHNVISFNSFAVEHIPTEF